jgi:hypothetical protein
MIQRAVLNKRGNENFIRGGGKYCVFKKWENNFLGKISPGPIFFKIKKKKKNFP